MAIKNKIDEKYITSLFQDLTGENRIALSKAITLVESQNSNHFRYANDLIESCLLHSGKSIRIGITGTPGVGKSTFIEALGLMFIEKGHRVAVLTIDPSSPTNQGSILGDKSRMEKLSHHQQAYVRSSPARTALGGTTDRTRETIIICEAAKYDVIIVETVGVGQSETAVINMTDLILLLALPGGGDEIQGIKRGIVEVADMIIVNKVDKFKKAVINDTLNTYKFALHLKPVKSSQWSSLVRTCSAITGEGMDQILSDVTEYFKLITESGYINENRNRQNETWFYNKIEQEAVLEIRKKLKDNPQIKEIQKNILEKKWSIQRAAQEGLRSILKN